MPNAYSCNDFRKDKSWGEHFTKNMNDMGLETPVSLYSSAKTFLMSVGPIIVAIEKFGTTATLAEVATTGAGVTSAAEIMIAGGAVAGSWYIGASIGSAFVATTLTLNCDGVVKPKSRGQMGRKNRFKAVDVISFAKDNGVYSDWLGEFLEKHPEVYDESVLTAATRKDFAVRAKVAA